MNLGIVILFLTAIFLSYSLYLPVLFGVILGTALALGNHFVLARLVAIALNKLSLSATEAIILSSSLIRLTILSLFFFLISQSTHMNFLAVLFGFMFTQAGLLLLEAITFSTMDFDNGGSA